MRNEPTSTTSAGDDNVTPLLTILRQLSTAERRAEFAALANTSVAYLYQLAGCNRNGCRTRLAVAIANASIVMHDRYLSDMITVEQLAVMCPLPAKNGASTPATGGAIPLADLWK